MRTSPFPSSHPFACPDSAACTLESFVSFLSAQLFYPRRELVWINQIKAKERRERVEQDNVIYASSLSYVLLSISG